MQHRYETHRKWNTGVFGGAMAAIWLAVFTLPALAQEQPEFATDSEGKPCQVISYTSYEITKPGRYCLTHDIFVQWNGEPLTAPIRMAILIRASDVVLDLNGFTIGYRQAHPLVSSTGGPGITQTINVLKNVVIRNGKISRFRTGVELRLSSQALMEGIQKDWRHSLEESNQSYITIEEMNRPRFPRHS